MGLIDASVDLQLGAIVTEISEIHNMFLALMKLPRKTKALTSGDGESGGPIAKARLALQS